jgi:hypothetical protein
LPTLIQQLFCLAFPSVVYGKRFPFVPRVLPQRIQVYTVYQYPRSTYPHLSCDPYCYRFFLGTLPPRKTWDDEQWCWGTLGLEMARGQGLMLGILRFFFKSLPAAPFSFPYTCPRLQLV